MQNNILKTSHGKSIFDKTKHKLKNWNWVYIEVRKKENKIWFTQQLKDDSVSINMNVIHNLNWQAKKYQFICSQKGLLLENILNIPRTTIRKLLLFSTRHNFWKQNVLQQCIIDSKISWSKKNGIDITSIFEKLNESIENANFDSVVCILDKDPTFHNRTRYNVIMGDGCIKSFTPSEIDTKLMDNYNKYSTSALLDQIIAYMKDQDHKNCENCRRPILTLSGKPCIFCTVFQPIANVMDPARSHKRRKIN